MIDPAQVASAAPKAPKGAIGGLTGLLIALAEVALSAPEEAAGGALRESGHGHPPDAVCNNCPICQLSVRLAQIDPHVVADLATVARDLVVGLAGSMAAATRDRVGQSPD